MQGPPSSALICVPLRFRFLLFRGALKASAAEAAREALSQLGAHRVAQFDFAAPASA
jgi:hypothetical protein